MSSACCPGSPPSTRSNWNCSGSTMRRSGRRPRSSASSWATRGPSRRSWRRRLPWAARRRLGMRHFDVQLVGGMMLHQGKIAEMATGEGKTLVATLPAYLNALPGKGVHIVTVNDYLAKRDAQWMGPLYQALGLSVGVIQHEASFTYDPAYSTADIRMTSLRPIDRRTAYQCDIAYGTNNEFGFD